MTGNSARVFFSVISLLIPFVATLAADETHRSALNRHPQAFSCDTWVVMPDASASGHMMLAKTSDVAYFECEPLIRYEGKQHQPGEVIDLQYVTIPQVDRTYTVIGAGQFWAWGFEQGINEHGVAIGNEAVLTKQWRSDVDKAKQGGQVKRGILTINLLRLGLERSRSAREAVDVITTLLEKHGQWGSCLVGYSDIDGGFDSSYIIADGNEAWILESAGRHWVAKKVTHGIANISNYLSIRTDWDLSSKNVISNAVEKGWWPADNVAHFDFARAYNDFETPLAANLIRGKRVKYLLNQRLGDIDIPWMFRVSRDHLEGTFLEGPSFNAAVPDFLTVCMHHSPANFTWGITSATNVFVLPGKNANTIPVTYWAANVPCCSCFVPFYIHGSNMPEGVSRAGLSKGNQTDPTTTDVWGYTPDSYWWQFDRLRMLINGDKRGAKENVTEFGFEYNNRYPTVRAAFDELEHRFITEDKQLRIKAKALFEQGQSQQATRILDDYSSRCSASALTECKSLIKHFEKLRD
jgi:secernin